MNEADRIVDALKKVTRMRGVTYAELAGRVGLSEASVKRLFSERTFTLARLAQFCEALDVDFAELARLATARRAEAAELAVAQETALAADTRLLAVFYLVINGWTHDEILARYQITAAQCVACLVKLDRLGLIDLLPGNRLRLRVPREVRLRKDGPIRARHGKRALEHFLAPQFDRAGGDFTFDFRELSPASFDILRRRLARIVADFHELAEIDAGLAPDERQTIGLALAMRPWSMEEAIELPPRARIRKA